MVGRLGKSEQCSFIIRTESDRPTSWGFFLVACRFGRSAFPMRMFSTSLQIVGAEFVSTLLSYVKYSQISYQIGTYLFILNKTSGCNGTIMMNNRSYTSKQVCKHSMYQLLDQLPPPPSGFATGRIPTRMLHPGLAPKDE